MLRRYRLRVKGIVQGVGFRPYVFNLASQLDLPGWVLNDAAGVTVELEGSREKLQLFLERLENNPPPLAQIESITVQELPPAGYENFAIKESSGQEVSATLVSPDIATCPDCLREMQDARDYRYRYPFINCTNCGPRFTIIEDIPYDRCNTTMKVFPMCPGCSAEYHDPGNRRFHAQPNACECCGPQVCLLDREGNLFTDSPKGNKDPVAMAGELLKQGKILAVKGLGGYHLACDAANPEAVARLRRRKVREDRPFAIMVSNVEAARKLVEINQEEELFLTGKERPIVLLAKKQGRYLAKEAGNGAPDGVAGEAGNETANGAPNEVPDETENEAIIAVAGEVAPGNGFLGVMLPYTPLHHLLLEAGPAVLVMTSGNRSSEPIAYKDEDALQVLGGIADYFLVHNREIFRRCDDSVVRVFEAKPYFLRRSRGFAPAPVPLYKEIGQVLACGAEQKNTFCLTRGQYGFMSHHIGDLENLETLTSFEQGIMDFQKLFSLRPALVAYDLHPEYLSTKFALNLALPKVGVQHHEAHIASCMAENAVQGPVLGIAFDGTGYGWDGHLWGGEFLVGDHGGFERVAHLEYIPLPGGAAAIKEPWRMALVYLRQYFGDRWEIRAPGCFDINKGIAPAVEEMLDKGINSPLTSSMGRLFDGVAALLGVRGKVNYEGQAAVELEQIAHTWVKANPKLSRQQAKLYSFVYSGRLAPGTGTVVNTGKLTGLLINPGPLIGDIVADLESGVSRGEIAWRFHCSVAHLAITIAKLVRMERGINQVCLSGGVFQNLLLLTQVVRGLRQENFQVYIHNKVPCNDGGIALGQAVIAAERRETACV